MLKTPTSLPVLLLVLLAVVLAGCGDDAGPTDAGKGKIAAVEPPPTTPESGIDEPPPADSVLQPADARGITFVDGFAAGAKKAKSPDELLFVYVGRHHPT